MNDLACHTVDGCSADEKYLALLQVVCRFRVFKEDCYGFSDILVSFLRRIKSTRGRTDKCGNFFFTIQTIIVNLARQHDSRKCKHCMLSILHSKINVNILRLGMHAFIHMYMYGNIIQKGEDILCKYIGNT